MMPLYVQVVNGKRRTCARCRERYTARLRHPSKCLTCDIRERIGAGETAADLGVRFDLPVWLFAGLISEAASEALEVDVTFDFRDVWAHDLAGRASAYAKLVTAGMDADRAAALAGLMTPEAA